MQERAWILSLAGLAAFAFASNWAFSNLVLSSVTVSMYALLALILAIFIANILLIVMTVKNCPKYKGPVGVVAVVITLGLEQSLLEFVLLFIVFGHGNPAP